MSIADECSPNCYPNATSTKHMFIEADDDLDTSAHIAAFTGDVDSLQKIIDENPDIIEKKILPFQATVLRMAVTGESLDCVKLLLRYGADVECVDIKAQTPVFLATCAKNSVILEELLKAGASPEANPKNRSTPILLAVRDGFAEGVKILTKYNGRTEPLKSAITYGVNGWALHHSVVYAHFNCFLALVQAGGCVDLPEANDLDLQTAARLSIPHAVLKYSPTHFEFIRLFYECGGRLWTPEIAEPQIKNQTAETTNCLNQLYELRSNPLTLTSCCRLAIRKRIGRRRMGNIFSTQIPLTLVSYLKFGEYEKYAKLTEENYHIRTT